MDESNFDRLLERYITGKVTDQEKKKIEAWFDVRKTRGEEHDALDQKEAEELFKRITSNIDNEEEIRSIRPSTSIKRNRTRLIIGIAASTAALFVVAIFVFNSLVGNHAISKTERIILRDGTIVWLRGESKFSYYQSNGTRNGKLEGEALFEIAKDPSHPFLIRYNDYTITVIGTSFTLRTTGDSLQVNVLTGKVRLTTSADSSGIILQRMESALLYPGSAVAAGSFSTADIPILIADTQYDVSFHDATMRQVTEKLATKFNVNFKFSDDRIGNCQVTADFTDHSLESTTAMLADVLNASFRREGNTIFIEGSGCD